MQWSVCGEETYEMCSGVCVGRERYEMCSGVCVGRRGMRCAVECVWGGDV